MAKRLLLVSTLGALLALPAFPQDDNAPPPGRVARLGYLAGTVSFQPASIDDWVPAELNHPVTNGDHIWTEADGLVELQTDNASIRMGARTNFSFLNLNDAVTQIEITTGTLNIRLHTLAPEEGFEIDTPQLSFTLLRNGNYRVDVNENGDTTITTVRAGDGELNIGDKATRVPLGTQVTATGGDNPNLDSHPAGALDQFDAFCADRDRREEAVVAARYISRDIPGYADLDGIWRVAARGAVWRGLVSHRPGGRLGPLPLWTLGLGRALGLELDRRCSVGLGAVPFWPLGKRGRSVGMGAGHADHRGSSLLCSGDGRVCGFRSGRGGGRRSSGLGPARFW